MIRFSAPGKIVLWGEYAVLAGAPAAVAAIDRRASATLVPQSARYRYSSRGFLAPGLSTTHPGLHDAAVARIANAVARHWGDTQFAKPFSLLSDSEPFYVAGKKLGIGSSAAMTVATYAALSKHLGRSITLPDAMAIHQALQGSGSGLDVATSWQGGVIKFQEGQIRGSVDCSALAWQVVWTGESASTAQHISDFATWRKHSQTIALDALADASQNLFADFSVSALIDYSARLRALDLQAKLNIYTQAHVSLATIARELNIAYKPCGAGGGDIGMAFSEQQDKLDAFRNAAQNMGFTCPNMEIATDGVRQEQQLP